ncbi:hypothetical protein BOSE62_71488 [Bosea sp. 62]|nr:hypothetical protein BOSE21B_90128 [Bosea sp. 21B]CAD5299214.1 hypothetical protein BOSE7B_60536 [Bosea sp. 7B]VXC92541.1 hypothetical protein BOSE62_71488 [Bosea sp. 62]
MNHRRMDLNHLMSTSYPRDLVGYGRNAPHPHWPGQRHRRFDHDPGGRDDRTGQLDRNNHRRRRHHLRTRLDL